VELSRCGCVIETFDVVREGTCKRKKYKVEVASPRCLIIITKTARIVMEAANANAQALREQILATEAQLQKLKKNLAQVEASDATQSYNHNNLPPEESVVTPHNDRKWPLSEEEYKRYGRQMIVPSIGIEGF
jgi:hypothetical protein